MLFEWCYANKAINKYYSRYSQKTIRKMDFGEMDKNCYDYGRHESGGGGCNNNHTM